MCPKWIKRAEYQEYLQAVVTLAEFTAFYAHKIKE
jgi:hypothetical protein